MLVENLCVMAARLREEILRYSRLLNTKNTLHSTERALDKTSTRDNGADRISNRTQDGLEQRGSLR